MKCQKLTFRTPLFMSIDCSDIFQDERRCIELNAEGTYRVANRSHEIVDFIDDRKQDLTKYVPEELKHLIVKAEFGDYEERDCEFFLVTTIYTRKPPSVEQAEAIREWIIGQLSDGWGEGMETYEVIEAPITISTVEFDEDYCEFDCDEYEAFAYYYLHPWTSDSYIEISEVEECEIEIDNAEPVVVYSSARLEANGEYTTKTVYKFVDAEAVISFLWTSNSAGSDVISGFMEGHGTFGCAVDYVIIRIVDKGFAHFLPLLGIVDHDTKETGVYTIDELGGFTRFKYDDMDEFYRYMTK